MLDGFRVLDVHKAHIFTWDIEPYKRYEYQKAPEWANVSDAELAALERELGWHLLGSGRAGRVVIARSACGGPDPVPGSHLVARWLDSAIAPMVGSLSARCGFVVQRKEFAVFTNTSPLSVNIAAAS